LELAQRLMAVSGARVQLHQLTMHLFVGRLRSEKLLQTLRALQVLAVSLIELCQFGQKVLA
jgi:uncharacterized protein YhhL (DUF1145 family)